MTLVIALSFCVLSISFLCSLLEAVVLSISPAFVAVAVKNKKKYAILLEHLKDNIDRPLAAILTLNTISHTLGSAVIGATVHEQFGNQAVTIFSVVLTLCVLVLAEIVPKIIGATYWKQLAPLAAYSIQIMIFLLYPFVKFSEMIGQAFDKGDAQTVTREEVIMTAELGADEGTLHKKETLIIKNLLMLDNIFVSDIMTPRSVFTAIEADLSVEEVAAKYRPIRFSRIPVFRGSLDNIIGMTHRYKILEELSHDHHKTPISALLTPIISVPERMTVSAVLDLFIKRKEHLALAIDEYGVVTGLVTLEDAVETLLGVEIVDEFDKVADMRQYALEQWQQRKAQIRRTQT